MEVRELVSCSEFLAMTCRSAGSALKLLEGNTKLKSLELMDAVDNYILLPERATDNPLLMPVEDVFTITGRGALLPVVQRGTIKVRRYHRNRWYERGEKTTV